MITAEFLKQFCAAKDTKYVLSRPIVYEYEGRNYTYATDGHRLMIVDGILKDCTPADNAPKIGAFLKVEPQGAIVNTTALKEFLQCGQPTTDTCKECDGSGETRCICHRCDDEHIAVCDCAGERIRLVRKGRLGIATINRCLLADMVADIEDETVLLHIPNREDAIHLFATDRHICVMPMRDEPNDRSLPTFEVPEHAR